MDGRIGAWRTHLEPLGGPAVAALVIVVLDQATKRVITDWLGPGRSEHRWGIAEPVLALEYGENTGAAFGLLQGYGSLLTLLSLVVLVGLLTYYLRVDQRSATLVTSVGLLTGGAIGNLADRLRLGYVVDFIVVGSWPTFNLADSAISVGVVLLAWHLMVEPTTPPLPAPEHDSAASGHARPASAPPAMEG